MPRHPFCARLQNVCRAVLLLTLLGVVACHKTTLASGGPPKPGTSIPSRACSGNAPVDDALKAVPKVRASWFNPWPGERLYVLEAGPETPKQATLVLIHGVGNIGTGDFYPVLEELSHTRHVLAVDLPGFGRSNLRDNDFGPERLVDAVDRVVRACATKRIDLLGHSSGGALALLYAATHSELVDKLVLVDIAGILRPEVLLRGQLHQSFTDAREKMPVAMKLVEQMSKILIDAMRTVIPSATDLQETGLIGSSPQVIAATRLLDYNFGRAVLDVRADTLILWGKKDQVMPPRIAHLLNDRIERSDLVFIDDAGHVPMKDQPALFASMVTGFLSGDHAIVPDSGPPKKTPRADAAAARATGPVHLDSRGKPEKPANTSTRVARCERQEDMELEGDYATIEVAHCKRIWLNHVRAQTIHVSDSDGRLDGGAVAKGMVIERSEFSLTGGDLMGETALEVRESKLDLAGVQLLGDQRALSVDGKSELVFSVSPVQSPRTAQMMHEILSRNEPYEM